MRVGWLVALALLVAGCVPATDGDSGLPDSDVWGVDLTEGGEEFTLGTPVNLTDRAGYDNQPNFLPDGSGFLYASHDGEQTDIWLYRFDPAGAEPLTRTPENEYSPAPIPGEDGFSVVRVEADGDRRVWSFLADGTDPRLLIEWEDGIEYHSWIDAGLVALRVAGAPNELKFADPAIGWVEKEPVAYSVGRSFGPVAGNNAFTFVHQVSPEEWWVRQVDLLTRETFGIVRTLAGVQDFTWTPQGALLMADGSTLYRHRPTVDDGWVEVADFSRLGVVDITRLEVNVDGTRLLFVAATASEGRGE